MRTEANHVVTLNDDRSIRSLTSGLTHRYIRQPNLTSIRNAFMRRLALFARLATAAACSMFMCSVNTAHAADDPAAKAQQTLRIGFVPGPIRT
jgi:hypothetical protein